MDVIKEQQRKTEDIDFVIAWVDGNDPAWQKEKRKYWEGSMGDRWSIDQGDYRYRDWDLLRYWFRAVEKYAPWVRKVHFVTCGQIPEWLNLKHPKLRVVKHEEYMPSEYVPTFNSHTIELNLHRISGLAEQFVYFNDDMYITRPVHKEDFFVKGLPKDVFALDAIYCASGSAGSYNCNNIAIINDHFNKKQQLKRHYKKWFRPCYGKKQLYQTAVLLPWRWFPGFYYQHLPSNLLKSTLAQVWEAAGDILDATSRNKFRSKTQVNQWVFKYWQLADGRFEPQSAANGRCYHLRDQGVEDLCQAIRTGRYALICINDTDRTTEFEKKKEEIRQAFEASLPDPSEYEGHS